MRGKSLLFGGKALIGHKKHKIWRPSAKMGAKNVNMLCYHEKIAIYFCGALCASGVPAAARNWVREPRTSFSAAARLSSLRRRMSST